MKKYAITVALLAMCYRHGWRYLSALGGVFAKQKLLCIIAAWTLLLCNCSSPYQGEMGTISINLGGGMARSAGWNGMVGTGTDLELIHVITLTPLGGGSPTTITTAPNETGVINRTVPVNTYTVNVKATVNGWNYAEGTATDPLTVTATGPNEATINMGRLPNAVALDKPIGFTHDFGSVGASSTPVPFDITVYNFTSTDPLVVTTTLVSSSGFTVTPSVSVDQDDSGMLTITPVTSISGNFTPTLTISANGHDIANIGLSLEVTAAHPLSVWTAITDPTVESAFPNAANSASISINAIAYGNGRLVAGGSSGTMIYSNDDGDTWNPVSDSGFGTNNIIKITYGNGIFVAVGQGGRVSYSSDGISWTASTTSAFGSVFIEGIAFGNGRFVAGGFLNPNNRIAYSDNGATWTSVTETVFGTIGMLRSMGYGNGRFIAAGSRIGYSDDDGLSWTLSTTAGNFSGQISGIAYNSGRFVAGAYDAGSVKLLYSDDNGDNWIDAVGTSAIGNVYSVIYANGYFVAVGQSGNIGYSSDGESWIAVPGVFTGGSYRNINDIVYTGSRFIAVGDGMTYCDF